MVLVKKSTLLKLLNQLNTIKFLIFFTSSLLFSFDKIEGDKIINGFEPPKEYWEVDGGSCGESVLQIIFQHFDKNYSQAEINKLAGDPKRGIYSNEVLDLLKKLKIPNKNISERTIEPKKILEEKIINTLKKNHPIFFGVKIYPDESPKWAVDHFILLIGYNEIRNELIYNSFNERKRINISKLLNKKKGYSLISKHNYIFAIEFLTLTN